MISFFVSLFCGSNVIEMVLARWMSLSLCFKSFVPLKNLMFTRDSSFVFLFLETFMYLQDRIGKKNALINSSQRDLSI
jgi:hypothetical protein